MQNAKNDLLRINIDNYSGPLEVLLELAKSQKVDLANISITQLANEFIDFIDKSKEINLDIASEYLLMATWLAYLKSKLLLPDDEEEDFKATEVAEKLKLQLKKLELIRLFSDQLLKKNRLGVDVYLRGMKGGIRVSKNSKYVVTLYELLKSYSGHVMRKNFLSMNIKKLPIYTTEQGIDLIKSNMNKLDEWKNIFELLPLKIRKSDKLRKSGICGIFSAALELSREGFVNIMQKRNFDILMVKEKK